MVAGYNTLSDARTTKCRANVDDFWRFPVTTQSKQERATLLHRLRVNGVPLAGDSIQLNNVLSLRQIGSQSDSRAFDLGIEATGYSILVNISITSNNLSIKQIWLEPLWKDISIDLLPDPLEIQDWNPNYRFAGRRKTFEIDREQVINHMLIQPHPFSGGTRFQGLLLWGGMEPIPDTFEHNDVLPATVIVVDQFGCSYPFEVAFWIDRTKRRKRESRTGNSRSSLFSQRDPSPVRQN
jgi:hypothetical protein